MLLLLLSRLLIGRRMTARRPLPKQRGGQKCRRRASFLFVVLECVRTLWQVAKDNIDQSKSEREVVEAVGVCEDPMVAVSRVIISINQARSEGRWHRWQVEAV